MQSREGWERGADGMKTIGDKTYRNLVEFIRPCSMCDKPFSIFVTNKIAEGKADSNSFGLRNCEEHRRSRTKTDASELGTLRTANVTMREELTGLYERNRLLFEETQVLKAKLAKYELAPAMAEAAAVYAAETPGASEAGMWQLQKVTASPSSLPKHPWEA